jgi:hypothetical protein
VLLVLVLADDDEEDGTTGGDVDGLVDVEAVGRVGSGVDD